MIRNGSSAISVNQPSRDLGFSSLPRLLSRGFAYLRQLALAIDCDYSTGRGFAPSIQLRSLARRLMRVLAHHCTEI